MDTAAVQCWRPDISFSTERLSWLVSRMASSDHQEYQESANRNYQTLSNFEQLLRENLKSCDNHDFQHHSMLWHHFLRHSRVRRSPWAWPREHVCLGRGPMASIVTMCHVSCIHTLCCWQRHAPTANKTKKTTHILCLKWCLDAMSCIDLFVVAVWVFTVSRPDIHTYNMPLCISCLSVPFCALWSFVHSTLTREEKPAITPKNNAMLRNSRCKSHHVEVQAVPVLDASFQPAGAGYLLHSGWWRGCTHIADLRTATGRQLPGGQAQPNRCQSLPGNQKKWIQVTIMGRSHCVSVYNTHNYSNCISYI